MDQFVHCSGRIPTRDYILVVLAYKLEGGEEPLSSSWKHPGEIIMAKQFKELTDYLLAQGVEEVDHTGKSYLAHLIGVYKLMEAQGCPEELCRAGMFHSIYGTERFQGFKLPLEIRAEIRALIGERAERLAYLNCAMDRSTFDRAVKQTGDRYTIIDRLTGENVTLSREDFDDLCRIHLYDWLEQVPRSQEWGYRREAYRNMAARLGEAAQQAYDRVFAAEAVGANRG
jgi:hypothetical protein